MRLLIQIGLVVLLSGCASTFRPVYTSVEGDYYLEESSTVDSYYGTGSVLYADIGFHPWWVDPYNPLQYVYYSPYFYPHYFSVWYPPAYSPYYRNFGYFYPGFDPYWCPPYLARRTHQTRRVTSPIPDGRFGVSQGSYRRSRDIQGTSRMVKSGNGTVYKSYETSRGIKSERYGQARPTSTYPAMGVSQSTGRSSFAPRAKSSRRSRSASGVSPSRSKR